MRRLSFVAVLGSLIALAGCGGGGNTVTGDFSSGAAGLWIENGKVAYPVSEITIAGKMQQMLFDVAEIGSDLEFRSSIASPTLRIDGMTVAGE